MCSYHFIDKQPTEQNLLPQLMLGYKRTVRQGRRIIVRQTKEHSKLQRGGKRKASSTEGCDIPEKRLCEENDSGEEEECVEGSDDAQSQNGNLSLSLSLSLSVGVYLTRYYSM